MTALSDRLPFIRARHAAGHTVFSRADVEALLDALPRPRSRAAAVRIPHLGRIASGPIAAPDHQTPALPPRAGQGAAVHPSLAAAPAPDSSRS